MTNNEMPTAANPIDTNKALNEMRRSKLESGKVWADQLDKALLSGQAKKAIELCNSWVNYKAVVDKRDAATAAKKAQQTKAIWQRL
jgi:hypothetical protein